MRRNVLILAGIAMMLAIVLSIGSQLTGFSVFSANDPISIQGSQFPSNRFFYLAEEMGFFDEEGVDVVIKEIPDEQAVQAFAAGELDFLHLSPDWYAIVRSQGVQGKQLMLFEIASAAEGMAVSKDIDSLSDLKGKRVAVWEGTILHFQLLLMLESWNISEKDIEIISLPPDAAMIAFISEDVDAAAAYEPWLSQYGEREGAKLLYTDKDMPLEMVSSLVASDEVLRERPEDVSAFLRGFFRAVAFYREHPNEANEIMGRSIGISADDFKFFMDRTKVLDYDESMGLVHDGSMEEITDAVNRVWLREGILQRPLTVEESYDTGFLENLY